MASPQTTPHQAPLLDAEAIRIQADEILQTAVGQAIELLFDMPLQSLLINLDVAPRGARDACQAEENVDDDKP
jgi:hypothetical protein